MSELKPRRVIAIITRTVKERATVFLDRSGNVDEVEDVHELIDYDDVEIVSIHSVLSSHS